MDFALPRAQNTFVSLKNPAINHGWCVTGDCSSGWAAATRAGLVWSTPAPQETSTSIPSSASAQLWYCCSSSLQLQ